MQRVPAFRADNDVPAFVASKYRVHIVVGDGEFRVPLCGF